MAYVRCVQSVQFPCFHERREHERRPRLAVSQALVASIRHGVVSRTEIRPTRPEVIVGALGELPLPGGAESKSNTGGS